MYTFADCSATLSDLTKKKSKPFFFNYKKIQKNTKNFRKLLFLNKTSVLTKNACGYYNFWMFPILPSLLYLKL
jgi:hypothetical protein